jgi:hypothetical protein
MSSLFALLFFSESIYGQDSANDLVDKGLKKSPLEKCIIKYSIQGDAKGNASRYIDKWGWLERYNWDMEYSMYGITCNNNKSILRNGLILYEIKNNQSTARKKEDKLIKDLLTYLTLSE